MSISAILNIVAIVSGLVFANLTAPSGFAQGLEELSFPKKLKLAKVGDEDAQMAVARHYETGNKVKRSRLEAAKWYRLAMEQGNVEAQVRLARLVHQGGDGLKQDFIMAAQLYREAAELGNAEAQNWLGYCFQHGIGVEANDQSAFEWYHQSADAGFAAAQNNLGLMYLTGGGTERSLLRAFDYFEKAAAQNDDWGLNNLGGMYEMGWGTAKDARRALEFYKKAAEIGNQPAQDNYARLSAIVEGRPLPRSAIVTTTMQAPPPAPPEAVRQPQVPTVFAPDSETHD
jgi:uncharacterized protein